MAYNDFDTPTYEVVDMGESQGPLTKEEIAPAPPQIEIPPKNKGGRPRKSDFSPQDAMLKEYQASTEMCQRIRQMIDKQYDLIVKQLGPTTNPRDRIALTEGLVDLYEKLVRTMGMAWKSMATKDPKPEEGEISLEELLELGGKKSANKSKH